MGNKFHSNASVQGSTRNIRIHNYCELLIENNYTSSLIGEEEKVAMITVAHIWHFKKAVTNFLLPLHLKPASANEHASWSQ